MRFDRGYVKLDRSILSEAKNLSANEISIFVTLLCWANIFESKVWIGDKTILVKPGMLVTSLREISTRLKMGRSTVQRVLKRFEARGSIRIESGTIGTVITICNWSDYQNSIVKDETPAGQKRDEGVSRKDEVASRKPHNREEIRKKEKEPSEVPILWKHYQSNLEAKGLKAIHEGAKTTKILKSLLEVGGLEGCKRAIEAYLNCNDEFFRKGAWSLNLLSASKQQFFNAAVKQPKLRERKSGREELFLNL